MLRKNFLLVIALLMTSVLVACGDNDTSESDDEELKMLEVEFDVPETANVDETVQLIADVTYGDEAVKDADEVDFEIWEMCDKDNSTHEIPQNNGDGSYTLEYSFEIDGIYEVYAHTTAHNMHTMPKKQITIGAGGDYDCEDEDDASHEDHGVHDDKDEDDHH